MPVPAPAPAKYKGSSKTKRTRTPKKEKDLGEMLVIRNTFDVMAYAAGDPYNLTRHGIGGGVKIITSVGEIELWSTRGTVTRQWDDADKGMELMNEFLMAFNSNDSKTFHEKQKQVHERFNITTSYL